MHYSVGRLQVAFLFQYNQITWIAKPALVVRCRVNGDILQAETWTLRRKGATMAPHNFTLKDLRPIYKHYSIYGCAKQSFQISADSIEYKSVLCENLKNTKIHSKQPQ